MFRIRRVLALSDLGEGFDGIVEAFCRGLDLQQGALRFGEVVYELGQLDLHKGDVEFEVDLGGGDGEGAAGVVEGGFHGGLGFVLFAFEEIDAAEAGEDLGIGGAVFGECGFVLKMAG